MPGGLERIRKYAIHQPVVVEFDVPIAIVAAADLTVDTQTVQSDAAPHLLELFQEYSAIDWTIDDSIELEFPVGRLIAAYSAGGTAPGSAPIHTAVGYSAGGTA